MFQWSSPSRLDPLKPIPLEIYEEIFSYFQQGDDMTAKEVREILTNLALVCRFFSSLALPRIFAKITFSGSPGASDDRSANTSRFCRAILKEQEPAKTLAQFVKFCKFSYWLTGPVSLTRDAFFLMYCNALAKMTRVESLELSSVAIDKRLLRAMKKMHHLKSLHFSGCSFAQELCLGEVKTFAQTLALQSLVIAGPVPEHTTPFHDAFTSVLNFGLLKSLVVDSWAIVKHLSQHTSPLPLENLTIHVVEDSSLLPALFRNTPELIQLHIYRINALHPDALDPVDIPSDLLPKLSVFDGPPALAALLVPSRPLHKAWLLGTLVSEGTIPSSLPSLDNSLWEALGKAAAPINEIVIPKHFYTLSPLADHLPNVLTLRLSWCHANWPDDMFYPLNAEAVDAVVRDMFNSWPPNPSVHRIFFDFQIFADEDAPFLNLQSQHETLQKHIVTAFPNIEQVNFLACINWRRSLPNGAWRAEVPKTKRKYMFSIWDGIRDSLVDYGGCFANTLNQETLNF